MCKEKIGAEILCWSQWHRNRESCSIFFRNKGYEKISIKIVKFRGQISIIFFKLKFVRKNPWY